MDGRHVPIRALRRCIEGIRIERCHRSIWSDEHCGIGVSWNIATSTRGVKHTMARKWIE